MKLMMMVHDSGCADNYVSDDDDGRWEVDDDSHRTGIDNDRCGSDRDLVKFGNVKNKLSFV
jgi:hypothetical protein